MTAILGLLLMTSFSAGAGDPSADDDMPPGMAHVLHNNSTRGCALPLPSRFAASPQLVADLPLTIRATVIRLISESEMSNARGPTDQSGSAEWAVVSVDDVVKGELSEKTLLVEVGRGCGQMFQIGQSGYLTGKILGGNPKNPVVPGTKVFMQKYFEKQEIAK